MRCHCCHAQHGHHQTDAAHKTNGRAIENPRACKDESRGHALQDRQMHAARILRRGEIERLIAGEAEYPHQRDHHPILANERPFGDEGFPREGQHDQRHRAPANRHQNHGRQFPYGIA